MSDETTNKLSIEDARRIVAADEERRERQREYHRAYNATHKEKQRAAHAAYNERRKAMLEEARRMIEEEENQS